MHFLDLPGWNIGMAVVALCLAAGLGHCLLHSEFPVGSDSDPVMVRRSDNPRDYWSLVALMTGATVLAAVGALFG